MKLHIPSYCALLFYLITLSCHTIVHSQTNSKSNLYEWFDNTVGKENLGINNGTLHVNPYQTLNKTNNYYIADAFSSGNVEYDGQLYYDVNLKYDIHRDILVLKPYGEYNHMGLNLIKEKTALFSLNGKNFINLSYSKSLLPESINGFYEEIPIGEKFIFYVKYRKEKKKVMNNETAYYEFEEKKDFVLSYKDSFYKIDTKKEITTIFPQYKNKINDHYFMNKKLEKTDKKQFLENLMKQINTFIQNDSN